MNRRVVLAAAGAVAVVAAVLVIPQLASTSALVVWETALFAMLFATSTNLLFGSAGIPSFGQAAFYGAGAYTAGMAAPHGWNVLLVLGLAIVVSAAVALGVSLFAWRTTGLAFAMLTLAIAQGIYTLVIKVDTFGGYNGLYGIATPKLGPIDLIDPATLWYFDAVCVAIGLFAVWRVARSPFGLTLNAIREDPVRATFLGVHVRAYRAAAFVVAGAVAGLAGALFAYSNQVVTPDQLYWNQSATPIIMLLVGGMTYFWGPALGALLLTWFLHYLTDWTTEYVLYLGVILMAVLIFLPRGLLSLPSVVRAWRSKGTAAPPDAGAPVVGLLGGDAGIASAATRSEAAR
jgi:branched-chain amino acid transport system permease protein